LTEVNVFLLDQVTDDSEHRFQRQLNLALTLDGTGDHARNAGNVLGVLRSANSGVVNRLNSSAKGRVDSHAQLGAASEYPDVGGILQELIKAHEGFPGLSTCQLSFREPYS
jgi:hypothetical protein